MEKREYASEIGQHGIYYALSELPALSENRILHEADYRATRRGSLERLNEACAANEASAGVVAAVAPAALLQDAADVEVANRIGPAEVEIKNRV